MQLIPAIDLRHGRVVRLRRGDDEQRTVYELDPGAVLAAYGEAGVERVHMVDLDAALGEPPQRDLIAGLLREHRGSRIELGGGLRDRAAVEWALEAGCERVVLTSLMARDFALFAALVEELPRRIVPALDIEDGEVRTSGWKESAAEGLDVIARRLRGLVLPAVLVTDIRRDGTLEGPNLALAQQVGRACGAPALLSGGVTTLADLEAACRVPEIAGAIVGRALYDGRLDLAEAMAVCRGEQHGGSG